MSPLMISGIIVFAVLTLIGIAYIHHALENAKIERARRVSEGNDRVRRIDYILNELPENYLSKGLRSYLLPEKLFSLQKMLPHLSKDQQLNVQKRIDVTNEELNSENSATTAPVQITSEAQAAEIKSRLQDAHRILVAASKSGRVNKADARKYNAIIKHFIVVGSYEAARNIATQARRDGKIKLALHHYMKASADLSKHNDNNQYTEQIQKLRNVIKHLQEEDERSRMTDQQKAESDQGKNELGQQLEDSEVEWKKKNVYD